MPLSFRGRGAGMQKDSQLASRRGREQQRQPAARVIEADECRADEGEGESVRGAAPPHVVTMP